MKFDIYFPFTNKEGKKVPGISPNRKDLKEIIAIMGSDSVCKLVDDFRGGNKEAKIQLPAVCFTGICDNKRAAANMTPTQFVMADIDHCKNPKTVWNESIVPALGDFINSDVLFAHVTCSGQGIRIVFLAQEGCSTLLENLEFIRDKFHLEQYGDYDTVVKDFSRISFLSKYEDILFYNKDLDSQEPKVRLVNNFTKENENKTSASELQLENNEVVFTNEELQKFSNYEYRGFPPKLILEKFIEKYGEPSSGAVHDYYNMLIKNFRHICNNDKRMLLYLLPRFGHTVEECWSQIKGICKYNTISSMNKDFYLFLKDNGFLPMFNSEELATRKYMMDEEVKTTPLPPYLPPIFKELVGTAPKDFILPAINALLPIIGTLTSYAQAFYPYDSRMHTTSFFSIIYAPPGTGKGFVEKFIDILFQHLKIRDAVSTAREDIYLRMINTKSNNDKSPDMPHTSLRIIPPKNSEAEFLQKQSDNHGYHMFTFAAEMDSWAKGAKAAGGNKDDMIRIAWDNGEYGQQFRSANTFKGIVKLYWNVLITGTINQLESYFKNVENGLVTRCSFTPIENQEFAEPPIWKVLSPAATKKITDFTRKCDEMSYETPCNVDLSDLMDVSDKEFDQKIDWKFKFKERTTFDCSWIMPTINNFHQRQIKMAAKNLDQARDVFRRRVAVRGFRIAIICMCLFKKPKAKELNNCAKFIEWWMERDLEYALNLWGSKYNEVSSNSNISFQRSVYDMLPDVFTRNDLYVICTKQGIKTPIRRVLFEWKKQGYIIMESKDCIKKTQK